MRSQQNRVAIKQEKNKVILKTLKIILMVVVIPIVVIVVSIISFNHKKTELRIHITCLPEDSDLHYEIYVDDDFVGSTVADCPRDSFNIELYTGDHQIRIVADNKKPYVKDITLLDTVRAQEIAVDFP